MDAGKIMRGSQPSESRTKPGTRKIAVGLGPGVRKIAVGLGNLGTNSIPMAMRARALPLGIAGTRVGRTGVLGRVITHGRRMAFRPYGRD